MKTVVQEKRLQLMLSARVMGWLGEQQWLLPCWKCDSFSSTSFLVLLFQSHTERCLKHPGAVTGGQWRQLDGRALSVLMVGTGLGRISGGYLFQPLLRAASREGISRDLIESWSLPRVDMLGPAAPLPPLIGKTSTQSSPSNPAGAAGQLHSIAHEVLYSPFAFPYEYTFVCIVDTATLCCSRY